MSIDPASPRTLEPHSNSYPRSPRHLSTRQASILDGEIACREVEQVIGKRDPEGARQVSRTATEIAVIDVVAIRGAPFLHQRDPVNWMQGANQHGGRMPLGFSDRVDQVVDAVVQVDVGETRRAI